jgi:hypothetical protein
MNSRMSKIALQMGTGFERRPYHEMTNHLQLLALDAELRLAELRLAELGCWHIPHPSDDRAVPFLRTIFALKEWAQGDISDHDFARCLKKAAREAQLGL